MTHLTLVTVSEGLDGGEGRGKCSSHSGHGRTNIYTTWLPANLSDTTVAVIVWAWLAIGCHRWSGKERHICGRSPVRTRGVTELKWERVQSEMLKSKVKSVTKQTSHRPSRFPKGLERRGPYMSTLCIPWWLIKASANGDYSMELEEVFDFCQADFNKSELATQLQLLSCMDIKCLK